MVISKTTKKYPYIFDKWSFVLNCYKLEWTSWFTCKFQILAHNTLDLVVLTIIGWKFYFAILLFIIKCSDGSYRITYLRIRKMIIGEFVATDRIACSINALIGWISVELLKYHLLTLRY